MAERSLLLSETGTLCLSIAGFLVHVFCDLGSDVNRVHLYSTHAFSKRTTSMVCKCR